MALWQNAKTYKTWDDGLSAAPGDEAFDTSLVAAKWLADGYNYMGTPTWDSPEESSD